MSPRVIQHREVLMPSSWPYVTVDTNNGQLAVYNNHPSSAGLLRFREVNPQYANRDGMGPYPSAYYAGSEMTLAGGSTGRAGITLPAGKIVEIQAPGDATGAAGVFTLDPNPTSWPVSTPLG